MFKLTGRTAIITGAGSGIGEAVASTLFGLGANVCLIARTGANVKKVAEALDKGLEKTAYYACDVRDEAALTTVRASVTEKFKGIDILVTCAAAAAQSGKTEDLSLEAWRGLLAIDLDGVFLSCKVFGQGMIKKGYGRIINLTSFHNIATYPQRAAYNAAKGGVLGLTRALAVEWGRHGITVNAVAPGPIRTPRTSWFLSQSPDTEQGMLGRTPSARIGETGDVAALIAFLATEEARHVNGQEIVIDGGWTKSAWWGRYNELK